MACQFRGIPNMAALVRQKSISSYLELHNAPYPQYALGALLSVREGICTLNFVNDRWKLWADLYIEDTRKTTHAFQVCTANMWDGRCESRLVGRIAAMAGKQDQLIADLSHNKRSLYIKLLLEELDKEAL